jgi:hypothetical protein
VDVSERRLRNQYIDGSRLEDPAEVVRALGAVQAQDFYGSLWAVGLRMRTANEAGVERAVNERRIVRTWPMRGTLHLVAADDVRWMLALLAPRTLQRSAARLLREYSIDRALIKRAGRILHAALGGGHALTRPELYARLDAEKIATVKQRGLHILWWLAHEGVLCCGPRMGKQHTFVLLEEWIPPSAAITREKALAMLALRYFAHHGPAGIADFAWWSGLTIADANIAIEAVKSQLINETAGKSTLWSVAHPRSRRSEPCHLLPVYDEYTVGYADRSAALDPANAAHAFAGYGIFRAPILMQGRIVGSWTRELRKGHVEVRATPLGRFSRDELRWISEAAERYGSFLGVSAKVTRG